MSLRRVVWAGAAAAVFAACQPEFKKANVEMKRTADTGIVEMEFFGTWERAAPVVEKWRASGTGLKAARRSLIVDFPFIASYVVLGVLIGRRRAGWAFVAAGLLDVVENVALLGVLDDRRRDAPLPQIAAGAAAAKWLLSGVGLVRTVS